MRSAHFTFRLEASVAKALTDRAGKRGLSKGAYAKQLVVSALEEERRNEELLDRVANIERLLERGDPGVEALRLELHGLRVDLATLLRVILVNALKIPDEKATAWVREHLLRRHAPPSPGESEGR